MAELTQKERLQPSLLDRLTDDEPDKTVESREQRVLSLRRLREGVLRDLGWLLNAVNMTAGWDLAPYPEVRQSVLNFGLPDLAGQTASGVDVNMVERLIRQAVIDFEPRILRRSVKVRAIVSRDEMSHNAVAFEIAGELWAQPVPLQMYMKTELDLESGSVNIQEYSGSGDP